MKLWLQIVHQTTEAVSENRDRVQHLNNTFVVLQLNTQLISGVDEWSTDNQTLANRATNDFGSLNAAAPAGLRATPEEEPIDQETNVYDEYREDLLQGFSLQ